MDTDEYIDFALIVDNGVLISDTFETWRQKANGMIVETAALGERVDELSDELFPGSVPNFVTLLTAQNINSVKTFGAGSAGAPFLKVGAAGFYYDTTGGINALTSTTTLRSAKLINSGSVMALRGIDYTLPSVGPTGSKYSFMIANTAGNQMGWMTASDMIIGSTLATDSFGRLYVNQITSYELAAGAVGTVHIVDGHVTAAKLATDSVTTAKIAAKQVTAAKIADGTITALQMAANSVGNSQLANDSVNASKIAAGAVGNSELADNSIDSSKIGGSNVPRQMVQDSKTNTFAVSPSGWEDIGLAKNITVQSGCTVRAQATVNGSSSDGDHPVAIRIVRNSTVIGVPGTAGDRISAGALIRTGEARQIGCAHIDFFDTPNAGTHTYKVQARVAAGITGYINRSNTDSDANSYYRVVSTLTLTELS